MNQQQWLAEERRKYLEREVLLRRCEKDPSLFGKGEAYTFDVRRGAKVAVRTEGKIEGGVG